MARKILGSTWFKVLVLLLILVPALFLVGMKLDFGRREDVVLKYFSQEPGMPEAFAMLQENTTEGSVVLCWWDYGRAVQQWSHREVIEAYPSRDLWYTLGISRDALQTLEAQLFGTWGSSEKIHDLATMFMSTEEEAMPMMRSYNVSYVLVFTPDDLQKFGWIARIAGLNSTDYLTVNGDDYQPTELGSHVMILRLLFDETLHPAHFTKLYDNGKGKVFSVDY
jgi:hypothetical protein